MDRVDVGRKLVRTTLTNALATVYTTGTQQAVMVRDIVACNFDSSDRTVTVKLGGQFILSAYPVPAGKTVQFTMRQTIHAGELIEANASANSAVALHISGHETT